MINSQGIHALDWSVYSGPDVNQTELLDFDYEIANCDLETLAHIIYT